MGGVYSEEEMAVVCTVQILKFSLVLFSHKTDVIIGGGDVG